MLELDLTTLDDTQLAALQTISPAAVKQERRRRNAFPDQASGLSALFTALLSLEHGLAGFKNTAATKAVKDSGIIEIGHRYLVTCELSGVAFDKADILKVVTPASTEAANANVEG